MPQTQQEVREEEIKQTYEERTNKLARRLALPSALLMIVSAVTMAGRGIYIAVQPPPEIAIQHNELEQDLQYIQNLRDSVHPDFGEIKNEDLRALVESSYPLAIYDVPKLDQAISIGEERQREHESSSEYTEWLSDQHIFSDNFFQYTLMGLGLGMLGIGTGAGLTIRETNRRDSMLASLERLEEE